MSNKLIQEISLQDQGYSSGIKDAIDAVEKLAEENGVTTNSIKSVAKEMKSAQRFAEALSTKYAKLTDEAKNTEWGKAIAKEIEAAINKAGELKDLRDDIARQVKNISSDTRAFDTMAEGVNVLSSSMQLGAGIIGTFTDNEKEAVNMLNAASMAQGALNTVIALGNAVQKESNIMQLVTNLQKKAGAVATNLETAAKTKNIVATKAATVAQKAFNVVAKANPYVLLATAAVAAVAGIYAFVSATSKSEYEEKKASEAAEEHKEELMLVSEWCDKTGRSLDNLEKIQKDQPTAWRRMTTEAKIWRDEQERVENENKKLGTSVGDVIAKFKALQVEWSRLSTLEEQEKFLKDYPSRFSEIALSVNSVVDANNALVNQAPQVMKALQAMAEATAYQDLYMEAVRKKVRNWDTRKGTVDTGDFYRKFKGGKLSDEEAIAAGVRTEKERREAPSTKGVLITTYTGGKIDYSAFTKEEIDKVNAYRNKKANELNERLKKSHQDVIDYYQKKWDEAIENAEKEKKELGGLIGDKKTGTRTTTTTKKEDPLKKYNQEVAEAEAQLKEGLIDEEESIEKKIKALESYFDALTENGKITEQDTKELKRLKPVFRTLNRRLRDLRIAAEDKKIIQEANEEYAEAIERLNNDRKNAWVTEDEYNNRYLDAVKNLTNKYKTVTNANDKLIDEINKKQKVINNVGFEKQFKEFNIAVEAMIDDFNKVVKGLPLGNEYYNERRQAGNTVNAKLDEYNIRATASMTWNDLDDGEDKLATIQNQLEWIQENAVTAIKLGVSRQDVDTIRNIADYEEMDTAEAIALSSAIDTINSKIGNIKHAEFLDLTDTQEQLDWLRKHIIDIAGMLSDETMIIGLQSMSNVAELNTKQLDMLDVVIKEVRAQLNSGDWKKNWFNEFSHIIDENNQLLGDDVKKIHSLADAMAYLDKYNAAREYQNQSYVARRSMVANQEVGMKLVNVSMHFKMEDFNKFAKEIEDAGIKMNTEIIPENLDDIEKELKNVEVTIDKDKFNSIIKHLNEIKKALQLDVELFDSEAANVTKTAQRNAGMGDASNYSINATSYEQLNKRATKYKTERGDIRNFHNQKKNDLYADTIDEQLKKYQELENILVEINEKNERLGANIDTSVMESQMHNLESEINGLHDKLQKRLTFEVKINGIDNALGGINSLSSFGYNLSTLEDQFDAISKRGNEVSQVFEYMGLTIQTVQGIMETYQTVMMIINGIQDLFAAKSVAITSAETVKGAAETTVSAEETATIPGKVALTAANKALEASVLDLAAAEIFLAHASIPFGGVGIATGLISEMMATQAAQHAASIGLAAMAEGGIVGGKNATYNGDTTLIRANKGEMVLNNRQQAHLFEALDKGLVGGLSGDVNFKIQGDALVGCLKNTNKIKSRTGHSIKF